MADMVGVRLGLSESQFPSSRLPLSPHRPNRFSMLALRRLQVKQATITFRGNVPVVESLRRSVRTKVLHISLCPWKKLTLRRFLQSSKKHALWHRRKDDYPPCNARSCHIMD
ncbi:unnamed protein product [Ectocarpus sp. 12 AP-2014]